jgi:hypothetical protein
VEEEAFLADVKIRRRSTVDELADTLRDRILAGEILLWTHADALTDLTEVLRMGGRPAEAAQAAGEALALYERKGIVPSAARTRAPLHELGAGVGG